MTRLLLTEPTFARLQAELKTQAVDCIVMGDDGVLRQDGRVITADQAPPDCGYMSNELFNWSGADRFVDTLIASPALQWVQSPGAGVDHYWFAKVARRGARLTTFHGQSDGITEYIIWGVLNHFQNGAARIAAQAAHEWTRTRFRKIEGTRWLIIGFGAIGEGLARRVKAFDAHVTAVRRRPEPSPFADVMITQDQIAAHIGASDVIVLCAPQTPQTLNMVDAAFLAAMKPGSVLVNVARGGLIDDDALLAALDAGKPAHAVLDVFRIEPLPADSRFWDHPRVTLTAHGAGMNEGTAVRADALFLDNLRRYRTGEPLINEITPAEILASSTAPGA
jgi:phosphoglycerate dehydrogenase-like enzyme